MATKASDKEVDSSLLGEKYKVTLISYYKHNTGIHVYKYKIKLQEENNDLFLGAFDKMVSNSIKDVPEGRIKIVPLHEIIYTSPDWWPIRTYDTAVELFFDQMTKLLNSADELNSDEVIFEVSVIPIGMGCGTGLKILDVINKKSIIQIKNDDTICLE